MPGLRFAVRALSLTSRRAIRSFRTTLAGGLPRGTPQRAVLDGEGLMRLPGRCPL